VKKHDYKGMICEVENERIEKLIDSYVHSQRDRTIIKLSLIDNISYTRISQRLDLEVSSRTVQEIMNKWMHIILKHI